MGEYPSLCVRSMHTVRTQCNDLDVFLHRTPLQMYFFRATKGYNRPRHFKDYGVGANCIVLLIVQCCTIFVAKAFAVHRDHFVKGRTKAFRRTRKVAHGMHVVQVLTHGPWRSNFFCDLAGDGKITSKRGG